MKKYIIVIAAITSLPLLHCVGGLPEMRQRTEVQAVTLSDRDDCIKECQRIFQEKVREYQAMFESTGSVYYHDTKWLNDSLTQARNDFDNCRSSCE